MSSTDTAASRRDEAPRTYGQWREGRRAGLFGLGPITTGIALLILALGAGMMTVSRLGAIITVAVGVVTMAPLAIRINGRTGLQVLAGHIAWWWGYSRRQNLYYSGVVSTLVPTHRLPGLLAQSQMRSCETGLGDHVGIIVVPATRHYTMVLQCESEGTDLVDQAVIETRVARMAAWLSSLSREPTLAQAQIIVDTAPDPGTRLAAELDATTHPDAPELAKQVLDEIAATYPAGSALVRFYVALTFTPGTGGKKLTHDAACLDVAARIPYLQAGLAGSGATGIHVMSPAELARCVRTAFDPASTTDLDNADDDDLDWETSGPVAMRESWDHLRHDSGVSRTWGMVDAPRGLVFATTFSRLSDPDPGLVRKRVSLIYRPYRPAEAARLVENDKRDALFTINKKARPSSRDMRDMAATEQAAEEEAAGAGVVRFTVLVTATVSSVAELDDAESLVKARAGQARIHLRRMSGCQPATFTANLPVGIVLPAHASIPS